MPETVSINAAMAAIGYSASPDNEAALKRYIAEAIQFKVLPTDYNPFYGGLVLKSEVERLVQAIRIDTPKAVNAAAKEKK